MLLRYVSKSDINEPTKQNLITILGKAIADGDSIAKIEEIINHTNTDDLESCAYAVKEIQKAIL